jgi:hypothetical protein
MLYRIFYIHLSLEVSYENMMMVSKREAKKNRQAALANTFENMTKAAKIRKLFSSGRPRKIDQHLSPITAFGQGGMLFERVQRDMTEAGLDPDDVRGMLIVAELDSAGNTIVTHPFPLRRSEIEKTLPALLAVPNPLPVGVVISIRDHEANPPDFKQWASPFLSGPETRATLQQVLDVIKAGKARDYSA